MPKQKSENKRLESQNWVSVALEVLAAKGIDGVRVERLARDMNVTKGSFYWHFKDRDALLEAMIDSWRRQATVAIIDRVEQQGSSARARLTQLLKLTALAPRSEHGANVELSIRLWGRTDQRAGKALAEIDLLRLRYIEKILTELGFAKNAAIARAGLAYSFMRVGSTLHTELPSADLLEECVDALVGPG